MKKNISILFLFSVLVSCKTSNHNKTESKDSILFDARAFSVHDSPDGPSTLRKKLLHQIYLAKVETKSLESDQVTDVDLKDLKDNKNYNNNLSKLVISYSNKDELYYIPKNISKEVILNTITIRQDLAKVIVWKSFSQEGNIEYVVETNSEEVLENEKEFSIRSTGALDLIYPYQNIEVSLEIEESIPQINTISTHMYWTAFECTLPGYPIPCECTYAHDIPAGTQSNFKKVVRDNINSTLNMYKNKTIQIFQIKNDVLKTYFSANKLEVEKSYFKLDLPELENFKFLSTPKSCLEHAPTQEFMLSKLYRYNLTYKVFGADYTLEMFGELPENI